MLESSQTTATSTCEIAPAGTYIEAENFTSYNPGPWTWSVQNEGAALIRGLTESEDELNRLQAIVEAVDGVSEVRCEVSVRPASLI